MCCSFDRVRAQHKKNQEENKIEEVAALGKCIDYFSDLVYGHWLGQKGLKIELV